MASVIVDKDTCVGCGICYNNCSEVFEDDGTGKSQIVEKYREEEVDKGNIPDNVECLAEAAESCPVDAISLPSKESTEKETSVENACPVCGSSMEKSAEWEGNWLTCPDCDYTIRNRS